MFAWLFKREREKTTREYFLWKIARSRGAILQESRAIFCSVAERTQRICALLDACEIDVENYESNSRVLLKAASVTEKYIRFARRGIQSRKENDNLSINSMTNKRIKYYYLSLDVTAYFYFIWCASDV